MIAVVDYGMGNLCSVAKALQHVAPQASVVVTNDPRTIREAERVVFPGQGAMPDCMRELETSGLREAVADAARTRPFLGLCIGLQMLFEHSEEGDTRGLGLLPGKVKRFPRDGMLDAQGGRLKVPHMGWNEVEQSVHPQRVHPLWHGIPQKARFYFVHSYYVDTGDAKLPCATTDYAFRFTCAVARDNIFAVQFHPEKSQIAGLTLLRNFTQWRV